MAWKGRLFGVGCTPGWEINFELFWGRSSTKTICFLHCICLSIVLRTFSSFGISICFAETVFELFVISPRWQQICVHPPHTKTSKSGTWSLRSTFERLKNIHFSGGFNKLFHERLLTGLTNQSLSIYYCLAVGRTFLFITSKAPLIELIFSSYFSVPSRNPKV